MGRAARLALGAAGVALTWGGAACDLNTPVYFNASAALEVGVPDPTSTSGMMVTDAKNTLTLSFRAPTASEQQSLAQQSKAAGYQLPWLQDRHIHLELLYTVTNLDQTQGQFNLNVDGASEFTLYDEDMVAAAFTAVGQQAVTLGLMTVVPQTLSPGQVYQGVLREDDFHEASLDIDALGRWMGNFVAVLINESSVNPEGLEMVPKNLVRPALYQVTVHLLGSLHMRAEYVLRVRDDDGQLLQGGEAAFAPMPTTFMPTVKQGG